MSSEFFTGLFLVLLIGLIIYLSSKNRHYDEMQQKIRAEGYKLGYTVTIILLIILMCFIEYAPGHLITPSFGIFAVLMAGIVTFTVYSILKDSFFSIGERSTYYMIVCAIISVVNAITAFKYISNGTFLENGVVTFDHGGNLICALGFMAVFVALFIKKVNDRKGINA